ncbi:ABC transporter substrate-binding protein [Pseudoalteromonas issachenkonii]|uniref:ABC transporter substrate-binding protein n=1 Tax=Pseudoalteromonas issachenkonii TaxID=152297 RepID=A0ABU9H4Y9_9GAMM
MRTQLVKTFVFLFSCSFFNTYTLAQEPLIFNALETQQTELTIFGGADKMEIAPFLKAFQKISPHVQINYHELSTRGVYSSFLKDINNPPDILLSSAMNLQIKLVNDGYAQAYESEETKKLPRWAKWRNEVFGFTYETAVIAFNKDFLANEPAPSSRNELLDLIRRRSNKIKGRIGIYDITKVGIGYLLWAHDREQSSSYGRMLESFGYHDTRVFRRSADILQAISKGEITVGYNILSSYARTWAAKHPNIIVVQPKDYTSVIMRSAIIPKKSKNVKGAQQFLDYLLSTKGQTDMANFTNFEPINNEVRTTQPHLLDTSEGQLRPVPLGIQILVINDEMKRQIILQEWENALFEYQ